MSEKRKKIILVEDDAAIIDIYETMMKKANFEIETFISGEEAIKRIKDSAENDQSKPDIILLDLILPDINGLEVFQEIKKNKKTENIKIFMLTNQQDSLVQWSSDVRPDKFLIKANTSPTQLLELIKQQLK